MDKLKQVLQSRKFWACITGLVAIGVGFYTGNIDAPTAIQAAVAALAAYSIATGIEDNGK